MKHFALAAAFLSCLAAIGQTQKSTDTLLVQQMFAASESEVRFQLTSAVVALGWERELALQNGDLDKFAQKYPQFKPFFQGALLLELSHNMAAIEKLGSKNLSSQIGQSYLYATGALGLGETLLSSFLNSAILTKLWTASALATMVGMSAAVVTNTLAAGAILAPVAGLAYGATYGLWGSSIQFDDRLWDSEFSNGSANVLCLYGNTANISRQAWLDRADDNVISGSWGYDKKTQQYGFATQESPIELVSRCAVALRQKYNMKQLYPSSVVPAAAVSLMYTSKVYGAYPIYYYSKFLDAEGRAIQLMEYFSSKNESHGKK